MLSFLLVDAGDIVAELAALQRQALDRMAGQLRQCRRESDKLAEAAPSLEPMLLAGVAWRVGECLGSEDPAAQLADLDGELVEFVLAPYLGSARARRAARG